MLLIRATVPHARMRLISRMVSIVDRHRSVQILSCAVIAEVAAWAMSRACWSTKWVFIRNARYRLWFHVEYEKEQYACADLSPVRGWVMKWGDTVSAVSPRAVQVLDLAASMSAISFA